MNELISDSYDRAQANRADGPDRVPTPDSSMVKEGFIDLLNKLSNYIEDGIRDYISENSLLDYLDPAIGHGQEDIDALQAAWTLKKWVSKDDYPWWDHE